MITHRTLLLSLLLFFLFCALLNGRGITALQCIHSFPAKQTTFDISALTHTVDRFVLVVCYDIMCVCVCVVYLRSNVIFGVVSFCVCHTAMISCVSLLTVNVLTVIAVNTTWTMPAKSSFTHSMCAIIWLQYLSR